MTDALPIKTHEFQMPTGFELKIALIKAQKDVSKVGKDSVNEYGGYSYASAEAMIEACGKALSENDLAFIRIEAGGDSKSLHSVFELIHASGESKLFETKFPVFEKKGTPIDKAWSIALTTSHAYMLRDLLLVCRKGEEMADGRHDGNQQQPQQKQQNWQKKEKPPANQQETLPHPKISPARLEELKKKIQTSDMDINTFAPWVVKTYGIKYEKLEHLTEIQANHFFAKMAKLEKKG